jgi:hypothetical protein
MMQHFLLLVTGVTGLILSSWSFKRILRTTAKWAGVHHWYGYQNEQSSLYLNKWRKQLCWYYLLLAGGLTLLFFSFNLIV